MPQTRNKLAATLSKAVFAVVVIGVAFLAPRYYGDPAPLGVPLPPVKYMFQTEGIGPNETSVNEKKVTANWLEFLAPQPDGSPPLRYQFDSSGADFEIWHPLGVEAVVLPPEQQQETSALAIATVKLDQPLYAIKYSLPRRQDGESLAQYAGRVKSGMEAKGAQFFGDMGEFKVTGYKFVTLEYQRETEDIGLLYHFLYIGPYGPNALVIDFSALPEHVDAARPYVKKIISSFKPKSELKRLYEEELDGPGVPGPA